MRIHSKCWMPARKWGKCENAKLHSISSALPSSHREAEPAVPSTSLHVSQLWVLVRGRCRVRPATSVSTYRHSTNDGFVSTPFLLLDALFISIFLFLDTSIQTSTSGSNRDEKRADLHDHRSCSRSLFQLIRLGWPVTWLLGAGEAETALRCTKGADAVQVKNMMQAPEPHLMACLTAPGNKHEQLNPREVTPMGGCGGNRRQFRAGRSCGSFVIRDN
ncbi:hypothetical protein B0H67DRAFT_586577 [Lasiosphaeris hirsuta]|uniref:Uncharacterized protein n=1 Tax=Lasiosphaeris hirsuta TaxID=260670 RepID=A0AA40DSP9_9PEZI|nr:hypothetical protein B0H67DRAFT_586577 [Lasiosphaeris hirsuta]